MNKNCFLLVPATILLITSCSRNNPSKTGLPVIGGLPVVDVSKSYPEKEIVLTDIAEVTYVSLDSKNDDFLYKGSINYITENTFVVQDIVSGSVLFFSKDGAPKSCFNHKGNGPQDYWGVSLVATLNEFEDNNVLMLVRFK